jgi:TolB-like protein
MYHKPPVICAILVLLASPLFANPAIAVIDFDSGSFCTEQEAFVMTGLFRNEMVRSGRADVVDRRHLDAIKSEITFQMSDWTDPAKIKQAGRMLGADYLVFGSFGIMGGTGYLQIEMTDIETTRILHSSRITLATWQEFDRKVGPLSKEFIGKLPAENIFAGAWTADLPHDGITDTYTVTFIGSNRCTVRVASLVNGAEITEEGQGTYSFDGNILKITAALRNSKIPHITGIQWTSVISIGESSRSFNMLAKSTSTGNNQMRVTFTKE